MKLLFEVPSSGFESYAVRIDDEDGFVRMRCECPAASISGYLCKHRQLLAAGIITDVKASEKSFDALPAMIEKAIWRDDLNEVNRLETEIQQMQERLKILRPIIANGMRGYKKVFSE